MECEENERRKWKSDVVRTLTYTWKPRADRGPMMKPVGGALKGPLSINNCMAGRGVGDGRTGRIFPFCIA